MSDYILRQIQEGISQRQNELHRVADILAKNAEKFSLYWTISKVTLIALGALAATKGAFDKLLLAESTFNLVFFTVIGLLVAVVTGLETTFKYESKNIELKTLAAECHSTARQIDTLWYQKVGFGEIELRISEAKTLLEIQDNKLADIQVRATKLGLNLTLEIRELLNTGEQPYLA
jgi:hypothetical protein